MQTVQSRFIRDNIDLIAKFQFLRCSIKTETAFKSCFRFFYGIISQRYTKSRKVSRRNFKKLCVSLCNFSASLRNNFRTKLRILPFFDCRYVGISKKNFSSQNMMYFFISIGTAIRQNSDFIIFISSFCCS